MTHTSQLVIRKQEIIHAMCEIARRRGWRKDKYLAAVYQDLGWQLAKIEYALARRHARHHPEEWRDV